MDEILTAEMSFREQAQEITRQAKRVREKHKSPDVSQMPGVKYDHNGAVKTWRFFKSKERRKKFLRETDIEDHELIN